MHLINAWSPPSPTHKLCASSPNFTSGCSTHIKNFHRTSVDNTGYRSSSAPNVDGHPVHQKPSIQGNLLVMKNQNLDLVSNATLSHQNPMQASTSVNSAQAVTNDANRAPFISVFLFQKIAHIMHYFAHISCASYAPSSSLIIFSKHIPSSICFIKLVPSHLVSGATCTPDWPTHTI